MIIGVLDPKLSNTAMARKTWKTFSNKDWREKMQQIIALQFVIKFAVGLHSFELTVGFGLDSRSHFFWERMRTALLQLIMWLIMSSWAWANSDSSLSVAFNKFWMKRSCEREMQPVLNLSCYYGHYIQQKSFHRHCIKRGERRNKIPCLGLTHLIVYYYCSYYYIL